MDTHEGIGAELSIVNVADSAVLPTLINPVHRKLIAVSADRAYDTKSAGLWQDGDPRNEAVIALKN